MRIVTGTYVGNGSARRTSIGARPLQVWALADAAQFAAVHSPRMWCGRSNVFANSDSINKGCSITDDGFSVGDSAQWNASGTTYHYVALLPTWQSDFDVTSYMGNATAGTQYETPQQRKVAAVVLKRDSALSGVIATEQSAAATLSSLVAGSFVSSLGSGSVTVGAESEVNQLDGPGGLGEEVTMTAFYSSETVATARYTGGQPAGSIVAQAPKPIKAAIVYRVTAGGASARIITDTMAGKAKPASAAALQSGELAIVGNAITVGNVGTGMNVAGVTYGVLMLSDGTASPKAAPSIRTRGKRAVWLSGVSSSIDCGTADGTLLINGPISVEWWGSIYPTAANNSESPLIVRGNGGYGAANGYSWGIDGYRSADGAFAWPGLAAHVVVSDRLNNAPDIRNIWRTGVALPFGRAFHVIASHQGGGVWYFYINGELVKQRKIDVSAALGLPNIQSVSAHKTMIGARWSGGAAQASQRQMFMGARVYGRGLTSDEAATRFARALLGSKDSDVTSGMAEEWDANNAAGIYLPASVSAANNGTIAGGSVVAL